MTPPLHEGQHVLLAEPNPLAGHPARIMAVVGESGAVVRITDLDIIAAPPRYVRADDIRTLESAS